VLGVERELDQLAQADPVGRSLQDARLTRSSDERPSTPKTTKAPDVPALGTPSRSSKKNARPSGTARNAAGERGFISSRDLAALISTPRKR
jgi:hypothetical protein